VADVGEDAVQHFELVLRGVGGGAEVGEVRGLVDEGVVDVEVAVAEELVGYGSVKELGVQGDFLRRQRLVFEFLDEELSTREWRMG